MVGSMKALQRAAMGWSVVGEEEGGRVLKDGGAGSQWGQTWALGGTWP